MNALDHTKYYTTSQFVSSCISDPRAPYASYLTGLNPFNDYDNFDDDVLLMSIENELKLVDLGFKWTSNVYLGDMTMMQASKILDDYISKRKIYDYSCKVSISSGMLIMDIKIIFNRSMGTKNLKINLDILSRIYGLR